MANSVRIHVSIREEYWTVLKDTLLRDPLTGKTRKRVLSPYLNRLIASDIARSRQNERSALDDLTAEDLLK